MILLPRDGYTEHIGVLVAHIESVRNTTFEMVNDLTTEELDFFVDEYSNSIGTLLYHIATVEFYYQRLLFFQRIASAAELEKYKYSSPGNMNTRMIHGNNISYYLEELTTVRAFTLKELKKHDDDWLFLPNNCLNTMNHLYMIRHHVDDELCHQGQIKWIKKRFRTI